MLIVKQNNNLQIVYILIKIEIIRKLTVRLVSGSSKDGYGIER